MSEMARPKPWGPIHTEVARLLLPISVSKLGRLVDTLEYTYGKPLYIERSLRDEIAKLQGEGDAAAHDAFIPTRWVRQVVRGEGAR